MEKEISRNIQINKKIQIFRLVVECFATIVIAVLLELAFNYHSFSQGYSPLPITETTVSKKGKPIYQKNFEEPVYIKKLILQGEAKKKVSYDVNLIIINDFGKEESVEIKDYMYAELDAAFTNINETVKQIQVVINRPSKVHITGISYSNQVSFSKYRMLFFAVVIFLILLILFEKKLIVEKIWFFYLVAALGFGSLIAVLSGPYAVTWDEEIHYAIVHNAGFSSQVSSNSAVENNFSRQNWISMNTIEEQYMIKNYLDEKAEENKSVYDSAGINKNYITHFSMILAYHLGEKLGLSYTNAYILGRLGNLLLCVLLNAIAIILAKRRRVLLTVIGMMPTVLFQSSMYTYDGVCFSYITLGVVLCANELEKERGKERVVNVLVSAVLLGIGCIIKPVYCPLFLLLVPIIWGRVKLFLNSKFRKWIGVLIACILGVLVIGVLTVKFYPLINSIFEENLYYGGDLRGGDTGMAGQILNIVQHPGATLKMFIRDMFSFDNFRNHGDESVNKQLICNQMFLNLYVLGALKEVWALVLLPLLMLLFLVNPQGEPALISTDAKKIKWFYMVSVFLSVILIWMALYLTFTPIGEDSIKGVQARYYIPLLIPFAYAVYNNIITVKISRLHYYQISLGAGLLLCSECIYKYLIVGKGL